MKENVENFFLNFFNWTKKNCIKIRSLKDGHVGVLLIGHFENKLKPVIFSLLAFDQFTDLLKELPTVITFLAMHPLFERQRLGSILLSALQYYFLCSEKSEKNFLAAPLNQEHFYLNLGFKEIDLFSDWDSEMGLNFETVCFLQNECKKEVLLL